MEAVRVYAEPSAQRPRLTVVEHERYAQVPHAVVFDNAISPGARLLYAGLQAYWWKGGECFASHATLAADFGVSERQVQRYLRELLKGGHIAERHHGRGRAKAYAPIRNTHEAAMPQPDRSVALEIPNPTDLSPLTANPTDLSSQPDRSVVPNPTDLSPISRWSEVDTSGRKYPEREAVAADAAPEPAVGKAKRQKVRVTATLCPETFPLEEKHFDYGRELGLAPDRTRAETEKFLAHHRFKGTRGVDWNAGWQNWMRRAVQYDAAARPNGHAVPAPKPSRPSPAVNIVHHSTVSRLDRRPPDA